MNKYKIEKFDVNKVYIHPIGYLYTREFLEKEKPAILNNPEDWFVLADPTGRLAWYIENIIGARNQLNIDPSLSNDEALLIIEEARNREPEETDYVPTLEEKIQALEEFKALKEYGYGTYTVVKDNYVKGLWGSTQIDLAVEHNVVTRQQADDILALR